MPSPQHDVFIDPDDRSRTTIERAIERGHHVTAVHSPLFGFAFESVVKHAHEAVETDTASLAALNRTLRRITNARRIDAVFVARDAVIEQTALACAKNGIPFTPVDALRVARNKLLTRRALRREQLINARYAHARYLRDVLNVATGIGFPCVLKPVKGHGSILAFQIKSEREAREAIKAIRRWRRTVDPSERWVLNEGFICEEWLWGPVISVELACTGQTYHPVAVALGTTHDASPCSGYGNVLPLPDSQATAICSDYAISVCRALGLNFGVSDVEMVLTDRGPVLLEVNARRMGGEMVDAYELATGGSFSDILLNAYAGKPIPALAARSNSIAVIRKVMPVNGGKVGSRHREWLHRFRHRGCRVYVRNYALEPNVRVQRFQVVARILVIADTPSTGFRVADKALARLEKESGLAFVRGYLPVIAAQPTKGEDMTTPPPTPAQIAAFRRRKKATNVVPKRKRKVAAKSRSSSKRRK